MHDNPQIEQSSRWLAGLAMAQASAPEHFTLALFEAAELPDDATAAQRQAALGAMAAVLMLQEFPAPDWAATCDDAMQRFARMMDQRLAALHVADATRLEAVIRACGNFQRGFLQRLQQAFTDLHAGKSLAQQGIQIDSISKVR
jgi:hypothetical protein